MKKFKLFLGAFFLLVGFFILIPITGASAVGGWVPVGKQSFTSITDNNSVVLDNNNVPYMFYRDRTSGYRTTVAKYTNGTWQTVGNAGFSIGTISNSLMYFDASNTPYMVYTEEANDFSFAKKRITISRFINGSWETVNSTLLSTLGSYNLGESLSVSSDFVPYLFTKDSANSKKAVTLKFNGSSWVTVGDAGFSAGEPTVLASTIAKDGTPYFAFRDGANSNKATVMKYNGSSWEIVGSAGFSTDAVNQTYKSISIKTDSNNVPYIAYASSVGMIKMHVQKYNGTAWEDVGTTASLPDTVASLSIEFDSTNNPYISFLGSQKANVIKLIGNTWTTVGSANISGGTALNLSLDINSNDTPYVSYVDFDNGSGVTIMRYTEEAELFYTGYFDESSLNDGSVSGTMKANLVNKSFASPNATLTLGTHYTISNKPIGLTPSVVIDSTGKKATITFSGVATYHGESNDVSNLTVNFLDASFSGGNASGVINSSANNLTINFYGKPYASKNFLNMATTTAVYYGFNNDIAVGSDNVPYLFDTDAISSPADDYRSKVKKYIGSSWTSLGNIGSSTGINSYHSIALDSNNLPYIAYRDNSNSKAIVYKNNGSSWSLVGVAGFSAGTVDYTDIALDKHSTPYIVYKDNANSGKITVMKFNGTSWENVGNPGFSSSSASGSKIEIGSDNVPYVTFSDSGLSNKIRVMKFNGTSWENVGAIGFSAGSATYISLSLDSNNVPYVSFSDYTDDQKAKVMKFNGTSWENVGSGAISESYAYYTVLRIDKNNIPYLAYSDGLYNEKITVKRFVDGAWEVIGLPGFSIEKASYISMSLDSSSNPYLAYSSPTNGLSVTKLTLPPVISSLDVVSKTDSAASLSWQTGEGTDEIDRYLVKYKTVESDVWTVFSDSLSTAATTVTGLASRTEYDSEVSAINTDGVNSEPVSTRLTTENVQAPTNFSYASSSTFIIDQEIEELTPTITGSELTYSVFPALPAGLSLATSTGIISGTPTVLTASSTYVVTASNSSGSETFELTIEVINAAPSDLSYSVSSVSYIINNNIQSLSPTVTGYDLTYSISPALPAGLSLATSTGVISGTPTVLATSTVYTITVSNSTGETSVTISIDVVNAPNSLIYDTPKYYLAGQEIIPLTPSSFPEGATYSVSPALPNGLSLNTSTGVISGTPNNSSSEKVYSIVATTNLGNQSFDLTIAVLSLPAEPKYDASSFFIPINQTVLIKRAGDDQSSVEYSVSPDLPKGLTLDASSGDIQGFPVEITQDTLYTISVTNAAGSASSTLHISTLIPWLPVGDTKTQVRDYNLTFNKSGIPYVAYLGSDWNIYVIKYDTQTEDWVGVGGIVSDNANLGKIEFDSKDVPYVSYVSNQEINIKKYNGSLWTKVGSSVLYSGSYTDFMIDEDDNIYVTHQDVNNGELVVEKYLEYQENPVNNINYGVAPSNLSYSNNNIFIPNSPINYLYPTVTGSVLSYSVYPELPSGLGIDELTGIISGTPTELSANKDYVITAGNNVGSTTTSIKISVVDSWVQLGEKLENISYVDLINDNEGNYYVASDSYSEGNDSIIYKYNGTSSLWTSFAIEPGVYITKMAVDGDSLYAVYQLLADNKIIVKKYDLASTTDPIELTEVNITDTNGYYYNGTVYNMLFDNSHNLYLGYYDSNDSNATSTGFFVKKYNVSTDSWVNVGDSAVYSEDTNNPSISINQNNIIYVAYTVVEDGIPYAKIKKYDGEQWLLIQDVTDLPSYTYDIKAVDNSIYLSYQSQGQGEEEGSLRHSVVKKYDGANWSAVGDDALFIPDYTSLAISNDKTPYIYYVYYNGFGQSISSVKKYNKDTENWEAVGNIISDSDSSNLCLTNNDPVVFVSKKEGGSLLEYHSDILSPENNSDYTVAPTSISYPTPTYYNAGTAINPLRPTVVGSAYNFYSDDISNSGWLSIDSSTGIVSGIPIATQDETEYVIYANNDYGIASTTVKIAVVDSWTALGGIVATSTDYVSFGDSKDNSLYVAYMGYSDSDYTYFGKVKKYNGNNWEELGERIATSSNIGYPVIVSTETDAYVAYFDYDNYQLLVKKYNSDTKVWEKLGDAVSDNGDEAKKYNLVIDANGNLYISFSTDNLELFTKVYRGGTWQSVGNSITSASASQLAVSGNKLLASYLDGIGYLLVKSYEEFTNSGSGKEVSLGDMDKLISDGIMSPQNGNASSTKNIKFNQKIKIMPFAGASIVIPAGITMTAVNSFNADDIVASTANVSDLKVITPAGALKFGLPNLGLTLNSPITITIPVTGFTDGRVLKVYTKTAGGSWTELTTCSVLANKCSFETTHLSEFAAGTSTTSGDDNSNNSGSSIPVTSTCTSVIYSDFSQICANGYQYRNFISQSPMGCSLSSAQIEAARRACGTNAVVTSPTDNSNNSGLSEIKAKFIALEKSLVKKVNKALTKGLVGRILLQVEEKGEAWYINPADSAKYFLGSPSDAFALMRKLALGINNKTFATFKNGKAPARLSGLILLNVEDSGKAYYVNPIDLKLHYLGRPDDAFKVMRGVGLGINNANLRQIKVGEVK